MYMQESETTDVSHLHHPVVAGVRNHLQPSQQYCTACMYMQAFDTTDVSHLHHPVIAGVRTNPTVLYRLHVYAGV